MKGKTKMKKYYTPEGYEITPEEIEKADRAARNSRCAANLRFKEKMERRFKS